MERRPLPAPFCHAIAAALIAGTVSAVPVTLTQTAGLFMDSGEVGDHGEVAAGSITARDTAVPEPGSLVLVGLAPAVPR